MLHDARADGTWLAEPTVWRRYDRPLSVLSIGVDSFDAVIEKHGDDAGDLLLQGLTSAWQNALRS